ncbi:hypothetical protein [Gillisia sp. JM1]|uniref:hypothetical protein n=1 Tax=Gillisia sp. JM1 TaxID=1283286 RepID=UPI0004226CD6|nr:hypothetical protein [Gillisia sp. JM1]
MKNIWLFPERVAEDNGYSLVVKQDFEESKVKESDIQIYYSSSDLELEYPSIFIKRQNILGTKRIINLLNFEPTSNIHHSQLKFLESIPSSEIAKIFCGDVIFYQALRKLFPEKQITVRLHNCFSRILVRKRMMNLKVGLPFLYNLRSISKVEQEIFRDPNVFIIFLSQEDLSFYKSVVSKENAMLSAVKLNLPKSGRVSLKSINKIVWFGGIESHKKDSIDWFIKQVFLPLRTKFPNLEFHLFGKNTVNFTKEKEEIFGHGIYHGNGFPFKENSIYINPDIIGGGVKIKIKTYIENNIRFISSPYGFEGYSKTLIDQKEVIVQPENNWYKFLFDLLINNK